MVNHSFIAVIPARYASTRFPGKALAVLDGRPVIEHVIDRARDSGAAQVIVATDDDRIADAARRAFAEVVMTSAAHHSGTDRVAEVAQRQGWADDSVVVNVQGDAPLIPPESIRQVAELLLASPDAAMATLAAPLASLAHYRDDHIVKVVTDRSGCALYFSRAPIPSAGHGVEAGSALSLARRHVGLYAYRVGALKILAQTPPCELERIERLEQLRALWLGMDIVVGDSAVALGPDIDTIEDLEEAGRFMCQARSEESAE